MSFFVILLSQFTNQGTSSFDVFFAGIPAVKVPLEIWDKAPKWSTTKCICNNIMNNNMIVLTLLIVKSRTCVP